MLWLHGLDAGSGGDGALLGRVGYFGEGMLIVRLMRCWSIRGCAGWVGRTAAATLARVGEVRMLVEAVAGDIADTKKDGWYWVVTARVQIE